MPIGGRKNMFKNMYKKVLKYEKIVKNESIDSNIESK